MGDRTTAEYYVAECMVKCSQAILGARIYQAAKPVVDKRASKWFMLQLEEVEGLKQQLLPWHKDPTQPLVIEVFMHPWAAGSITPAAATPAVSSGGTPAGAPQQPSSAPPTELLLERWTLQFSRTTASSSSFMHAPPGTSPGASGLGSSTSSARGGSGGGAGSSARAPTDDAGLYKRLILLVRALYTQVRVLPAYRIFRACKRHQGALYQVGYRLQTHPSPPCVAAGGGMGATGAPHPPSPRLQLFQFAGVELPGGGGVLEVQVEYSPKPAVHLLEQTAGSTLPAAPRIITDYMADLEDPTRSSAGSGAGAARSAPAARGGLGAMLAAAAAAAAAGVGDAAAAAAAAAGLTGASGGTPGSAAGGVLRLHHAASQPIVRHTWSSRDMPARVVQRGFVPRGAALSPPATTDTPADAALSRSSSTAAAAAAGASSSGTPQQLAPTWSGGSGAAGPSSGKPPLPHAYPPPVGSTSPSTPQSVPRCSSGGLHRLSSSGKLGATGTYLFGLSPPSRVGSWGSTGGGPVGSAGAGGGGGSGSGGGGYSSPVHRGLAAGYARGPRLQADPVGQQITGFAAAGSSGSSPGAPTPGHSAAAAAAAGAGGVGALGSPHTTGDSTLAMGAGTHAAGGVASSGGSAADPSSLGSLPPPSAPVEIPLGNRARARARSATDLSLMQPDGGLQVWDGGAGHGGDVMAGARGSGALGTGDAATAARAGGVAGAGGQQGASRRALAAALGPGAVALAPSSAPAAPRGMLGQLLNANRAAAAAGGILAAAATTAAGPSAAGLASAPSSDSTAQVTADASASGAAAAHDGSSRLSPGGGGSSGGPPSTSIIVRPSPGGTTGGPQGWSATGGSSSRAAGGWPTIATPAGFPGPSAALSCSPQLPFAFTPSAQSAASLGAHLFPSIGPGGGYSSSGAPTGGPLALPSPPVPGVRDISGLATIRRPSWSSRSSSFDVAASTSMPHHMSVSPMADLLDPALLGSSAALGAGGGLAPPAHPGTLNSRGPNNSTTAATASAGGATGGGSSGGGSEGARQQQQGSSTSSAGAAGAGAAGEGASAGASQGGGSSPAAGLQHPDHPQGLLEHASGLGELDPSAAHHLLLTEESESDVLPFALEPEWAGHPHYHTTSEWAASGSSPAKAPSAPGPPPAAAGGAGGGGSSTGGGGYAASGGRPGAPAAAAGGGPSRDVAVGAFIKLLQDAPPLQLPRDGSAAASPGVEQLVPEAAGAPVNPPMLTVSEGLVKVDQLCSSLQQLLRGR